MQIPNIPEPPKESNNRNLAIVFILLALVLGGLAFLYEGKPPSTDAKAESELLKAKKRAEMERAVNLHIQDTNRKIEIDKEKIKQQAAFTIPRVGQLLMNSEGQPVDPINLRTDRNETNAARDIRRNLVDTTSAGDVIHAEMAEKEAINRQNAEYMREYAKQFVENARRNGYEVELSSDYQVLNVRKVSPGTDTGVGVGPAFR